MLTFSSLVQLFMMRIIISHGNNNPQVGNMIRDDRKGVVSEDGQMESEFQTRNSLWLGLHQ